MYLRNPKSTVVQEFTSHEFSTLLEKELQTIDQEGRQVYKLQFYKPRRAGNETLYECIIISYDNRTVS